MSGDRFEVTELSTVNDPPDSRLDAFNQHRNLLFSIAYRMLGSASDAEDMVQETYLRWQKISDQEIRSPRAMLVTIVSRLCINHLQLARVQREEYFGQWLPEPLLTATAADPTLHEINESLSMAFLVLLERLNPIERATLLLRDVFDYDYSEIASILGRNEAACRQILHRARQNVTQDRPRFSASAEEGERLMRQFIDASTHGDMDGLLALLSSDVVFYSDGGGKAAAVPNIIHGSRRVVALLLGATKKFVPKDQVVHVAQINGQPGFISYVNGRARAVVTVDVDGGLIARLYIVTNPEKLRGIPDLHTVN
ncbi:MAG TPA: RNA polymerase sigma-70 factor [Thermoanaerobaculia bacterium]|nr:RNA polymerase sigma-70 factor [Thermoanaerobaculia bacterium]